MADTIERLMDRLEPLWAVAAKSPNTPLRGHLGTIVGLALALLATAWAIAIRRTFTPWDPNLPRMRTLAFATKRIMRDASAYAKPPNLEAFADSPFAAWAGLFIVGPNAIAWWWAPVLWVVLHAFGLFAFCRLLGLRDWRAGFLTACLVNLDPTRSILSLGGTEVPLMLLVLFDLVTPRARPDESPGVRGRLRGWAEKGRGLPTAIAVAWNPFLAPFVLLLFAARHRRAAIVAGAGSLLFTVAAAVLSPRDTLVFFTDVLPGRLEVTRGVATTVSNQAPLAAYFRWSGVQSAMPLRLALIAVAIIGVLTAYVLVRRGQHMLGVAIAGVSPLLAQSLTWSHAYVWALPGIVALLRGRIPVATRTVGLLAFGGAVLQPWREIAHWHTSPYKHNRLETIVAGFVPAMLVLAVLVIALDVLRLPPGKPFGGTRTEQVFVRGVLVWLPWLCALWLAATFLGPRSSLWPWHGAMPDYEVYAGAGRDLINGRDFYASQGWPFLYPPFAALLAVPMGFGFREQGAIALQMLNALAYSLLFYRAGFRGWQVPFASAAAFMFIQVLDNDLRMGNVQGLIIAMVFLDTVPGSGALKRMLPFSWANRDRLIPPGVLTGIATSIKILPGLFIIQMLLTKRYKPALTALATSAVTTLLGVVILPERSVQFAGMVLQGRLNDAIEGGLLHYLSLVSGLQRFTGYSDGAHRTATIISLLVGVIAFLAAVRWYRAGHEWFGAAMCGIATIYLSPVAWNYYYIWLVPAALAVTSPRLDDSVNVEGEDEVSRVRHDLPESVALLTLFLTGWAAFQFHLALPAENNIEATYTPLHKLVAATLPFVTALLAITALVAQRPWGNRTRLSPPAAREGDSSVAIPAAEPAGQS